MIAINTEKKLVIRKAPTEKASTYENGFIATGSDNENYIVTEVKNGFKRWMKMKAEVENIEEKPKRIYKKKVLEPIVEPEPEPEVIVEEKPEKPKRTYKKKEPEHKKQCCEQGTQTEQQEQDIMVTPTKPKKERKMPDAPKKK